MNPKGGERALDILRAKPSSPANDLQKARSRMHTNPHSGHWVFLENPDGFNKIIGAEIRDAVSDWRREVRPETRL